MNRLLHAGACTTGRLLPEPLLRQLVSRALAGRHAALCLHRVSESCRPGDWQPELTMPAAQLDSLLHFLSGLRPAGERWLTVSFDDGYEDAAQYVLSRAPRLPAVEWLFFVCPEKLEQRVGFRWDVVDWRRRQGEPVDVDALMQAEPDIAAENAREDLRAVARQPEYRLADVALCRELQRLPNVKLGNHTNGHFLQVRLSLEQMQAEYDASLRDFTRLFGPQEHFAFPFGTPGHEFGPLHVRELHARGRFLLWSTARRPYVPAERRPGAVLPRFPIDGTLSWQQSAFLMAAYTLRRDLRRNSPSAAALEVAA